MICTERKLKMLVGYYSACMVLGAAETQSHSWPWLFRKDWRNQQCSKTKLTACTTRWILKKDLFLFRFNMNFCKYLRLWWFARDWDAREELQYFPQQDSWSLKTKSLTQKVFCCLCSVQYFQGGNPFKPSHTFEGAWFITPPPTPRSSRSCSSPVLWPCPISSLYKNVLAAPCDKGMEHLGSIGSYKNLLSPLHPFLCCTSLIKQEATSVRALSSSLAQHLICWPICFLDL